MRLYNSLTDTLEEFRPVGDHVGLYVCGITPYDTTHLGHASTYCAADVLLRYLKSKGWPVTYVQNVTDVDDDILREAREVGVDWRALGNRWTLHFIDDMLALNVLPPDYYPRASDVIPGIIAQVEALLETGVAYQSGGGVYFEIDAWSEFGKLSNLDRDEMLPIANQRGNHPEDPNKRNPLDFVLWQPQSEGEPSWASPWGPGRPGWHIECSTMATDYLGETIDLHLGGSDLLFPHHECEIAQVEPVTGQEPFARFWLHTAMVAYEGEKMSKSLGNLVMVRDLLNEHSPDELRLYLAQHHYRSPWEYPDIDFADCRDSLDLMERALAAESGAGRPFAEEPFEDEFTAAMDDDLNTPQAIQVLVNMAQELAHAAGLDQRVDRAQQSLVEMAAILGVRLRTHEPDPAVQTGWAKHRESFQLSERAGS